MKNNYIFVQNIKGLCSNCQTELINGGFLQQNKQGDILKSLCSNCQEIEEITKVKPIKIKVKQIKMGLIVTLISWLFGVNESYYEILSTEGILIDQNHLSKSEINKMLQDSNIDIKIKY